ncbi:hypothetical protein [Anaeromyxobacter oryzae]|uniref:Uncharacterized protein n=1 Tax=Anaeromyxobacter oryzae TaxID=2918170 RepID=A0ABM7WT81_9BACT|nr:hypothetical protein [Anaeromyxobacter oryzae]BDG02626.1 hypothetical protein AMOR_16220 [Anaeromyxobacter oryzae]
MANERTDPAAADAARQAAERGKTGGASVPAGGARGPGDVRGPGVPEQAPDRAAARPGDRVPEPEPEEAPELLGEQSDYPAPRGDADET